ncbi:hypothetical protein CJ177_43630 [Rhodococcus sp. ACPA1]|nr:hypothetical protein CJ177_43630 [Rhodococcus sp. ACPA1]
MELYAEWPDTCPVDLRLLSSMQALTDGPWSTQHPSVGGHVLHVQTVDNEFRYVPNGSATFEPTPGNGIFFTQHFATGIGTTPGAFAAFIKGRRHQPLFVHGKPWEPVPVQAETMEELISAAAELHRQELAAANPLGSQ